MFTKGMGSAGSGVSSYYFRESRHLGRNLNEMRKKATMLFWVRAFQADRCKSQCKCPEVEVDMVCSRNSKEACVTGAWLESGERESSGTPEVPKCQISQSFVGFCFYWSKKRSHWKVVFFKI